MPDLFRGEQLVVVGRYRDTGASTIELTGKASGKKRSYRYKVEFARKTDREEFSFVSRLWAQKKIGWLIEQIRLHGQKKEYVDEIVRLSTRYGIITEYTAFLADEEVELHATGNLSVAEANVRRCAKVATGAGGVAQSMQSRKMQGAAQANNAPAYYDETGREVTTNKVKIIGSKTFYLKKGVWTDSEYREGMSIVKVKQLSNPYFDIANSQPTQAKYMTFTQSEIILVVIEKKAYKIEPTGR